MTLLAHPGHIEHDLPAWLSHPAAIVVCLSLVAICVIAFTLRATRRKQQAEEVSAARRSE